MSSIFQQGDATLTGSDDPTLDQISSQYGLPMPGVYLSEEAQNYAAYQQALQQVAQQEAQASNSYGFNYQQNANTGAISGVQINNTNPYSQVMQMLQSHAMQMNQLRNTMGSGGFGSTGFAAQQQQLAQYLNGAQTAQVGQNFETTMGGLFQNQLSALNTLNTEDAAAQQQALAYAIQNQAFNAAPAYDPTQQSNPGPQNLNQNGSGGAANASNAQQAMVGTTGARPLGGQQIGGTFGNVAGSSASAANAVLTGAFGSGTPSGLNPLTSGRQQPSTVTGSTITGSAARTAAGAR